MFSILNYTKKIDIGFPDSNSIKITPSFSNIAHKS